MIVFQKFVWISALLTGALFSLKGECDGQTEAPREKVNRQYYAELSTYSFVPSGGIDTYRSHGSSGVGCFGTAETGMHSETQNFQIATSGRMKADRFMVALTVKSKVDGKSTVIEKLSRDLDLTDLNPEVIEVAKDPDGRVYRVIIAPRVKEEPQLKLFRAEDLKLDEWSFNGSPLILNDQDYLGTIGMSGGNLAAVDVPGLAKVEFSLVPLKNSTPEGVLQNGTITIRHEQTILTIGNVRNGGSEDALKDKPLKVFVRWNAPTQSIEQYREMLKSQLQRIKTMIDEGNKSIPIEVIARLERSIKSDRVMLLSTSIQTARSNDIDQSYRENKGAQK